MWPLEFRHDIVRVGARGVERWAWSPTGLVRAGHEDVGSEVGRAGADPHALAPALRELLAAGSSRRAHLVVESAWLPVLRLETGALWSRAQLQALLRYRLAQLFDEPGRPAIAWELMLDHRAGEKQAIGYGLAPAVKEIVARAGAEAGVRWASMEPAFAWGWHRLRRQRPQIAPAGWWLWQEQDRSFVCHVAGRRVRAMNTAAAPLSDAEQCRRAIAVERVRFGVDSNVAGAVVAGWDADLLTSGASDVASVSVAAAASAAPSLPLQVRAAT